MRSIIQIAGESGTGIESSGHIVMKSLKKLGYFVTSDREFPSLIKGGNANVQINFSTKKIHGMSNRIDVSLGIDREGVLTALDRLKPGGILVHGMDRLKQAVKDFDARAAQKNLKVIAVPARDIAIEEGGSVLMVNVVLMGVVWKLFGLDIAILEQEVHAKFGKKPQLLEINVRCLHRGFAFAETDEEISKIAVENSGSQQFDQSHMIVDGNTALAMGAIHAGMRAYFAYPMSPASSILTYLAATAKKTGVLAKQVEDEITAAQTVIGAMHVGTRSMTATSGGGFDLMTETVSLAGITETPMVIVIAQRPGPGTGLPTWTTQGDVQLAIRSGHGEFARSVVAVSDPTSAFETIQHAFNIAEKFQIPTIVLTEKFVADKKETVEIFQQNTIPIERGLATPAPDSLIKIHSGDGTHIGTTQDEIATAQASTERFQKTISGISKRWIPGTNQVTYYANGDEHNEDGSLDETEAAGEMIAKRIRKMEAIAASYPEPELYGDKNVDVTLVGFGSSKMAVLDAMQELQADGISLNYLHFTYLYPLKTERLMQIAKSANKFCLIEGNSTGQLGQLIAEQTDITFDEKLLKWNGRPFYVEDVVDFVKRLVK